MPRRSFGCCGRVAREGDCARRGPRHSPPGRGRSESERGKIPGLTLEEPRMVMERTAAAAALAERLETRTARVGVLGLGYAGLPMAVALGGAGYLVLGLDVDPSRASLVASGRSPVTDVADSEVQALTRAGRLDATTEMARLADCDVALICVPTPLGPAKAPDLTYVRAAGRSLAQYIHPGMLVILQSTVT